MVVEIKLVDKSNLAGLIEANSDRYLVGITTNWTPRSLTDSFEDRMARRHMERAPRSLGRGFSTMDEAITELRAYMDRLLTRASRGRGG